MGEAIGQVVSLGVGVAISPVPIIAVVLMLGTPRGRVNGPAFIAGWLAGLAFARPFKGEWARGSASRRLIAVFAWIAFGPGGREGCGWLIRRRRAAGFRVRREEGQGGRAAS